MAGSLGGGATAGASNLKHGQSQSVVASDVTKIFDLLESNNPEVVQEVKDLILENLNGTKENWLVSGLFEYYIQSGSTRCSDILCGISREPHDKFLIEKMTEGVKSPFKESRRRALALLGHAVCKQPSWLYKIVSPYSLFSHLIKLLKTETDIVVLLTGLLSLIMILPTIPTHLLQFINEFFDVFSRLAMWTHTTQIPKEHVLHLQVALYSLFHRLYGMFPCCFLSYLRHNFASNDKRIVFVHTIMPMLEKVKMHPSLVIATRDSEVASTRFQNKDYHDIIAECAKISLDVYESSLPEEEPSGFTSASLHHQGGAAATSGSHSGNMFTYSTFVGEVKLEDIIKVPSSALLYQPIGVGDLNSLVQLIDEFPNTAPPTPLSINTAGAAGSGAPLSTPFSNQAGAGLTIKTNLHAETAMEATPENTPVKDKERFHFKLPPPNTPAAIQLFGSITNRVEELSRSDKPTPQTPPATPYSSVPSSPLPLTSSMSRRDSIFDSLTTFRREPPLMLQRLQKVQLEQQQQAQLQHQQQQQQLQQQMESSTTSTNSAAATTGGPPGHSQPVDVNRKIAVVAPQHPEGPVANLDFSSSQTQPQQENDKTASTSATVFGTGGPLTPIPSHSLSSSGPGLIDPDLSAINLDDDPSECRSETCSTGGLHMADHRQMVAFARKVNNRLRYHSHCLAGSDFNTSVGPSPGTSPGSSTSTTGVSMTSARSRFMKRSLSCPDIKKPVVEDKDGSSKRPAKLPELSEAAQGSEDAKENEINETASGEANNEEIEQQIPKEPEPEHPYEHLFQKILPGVLAFESRTLPSPHRLLDICLLKAANSHQHQQFRSRSDEIAYLKGHIELLHGQLLFERHRREAHALRNRRLAGKCRKAVTLEEQNSTMSQKIHNLEKEIASLKKEVTIQRNMGLLRERELLNTVEGFESKIEGYKKDILELTKEKSNLETKLTRLLEEYTILHKESDQKRADYFCLENEVKNCQKYIERNKEYSVAYEARLKDILLLGELLRKYKENTMDPAEYRYLVDQLNQYKETSEEEVRILRSSLENAKSQQEAANGTIADLMKRLEKREDIIELQRKDIHEKEQEHQMRINVMEGKYEDIKKTNQRLELEILSLQHQLSVKTVNARPTRGRITSASSPSNNGEVSPAGNSNHSDVDSAASAGGFQMSPERKDIFIFGSPQFDNPSDGMKDLSKVIEDDSGGGSAGGGSYMYGGNSVGGGGRRRNSSPATPFSRGGRDGGYRP